jgi:hypothetical protein
MASLSSPSSIHVQTFVPVDHEERTHVEEVGMGQCQFLIFMTPRFSADINEGQYSLPV